MLINKSIFLFNKKFLKFEGTKVSVVLDPTKFISSANSTDFFKLIILQSKKLVESL